MQSAGAGTPFFFPTIAEVPRPLSPYSGRASFLEGLRFFDCCGNLTKAFSCLNTHERFFCEKVREEEPRNGDPYEPLSSLVKEVIRMEEGALAGFFAIHFATITAIIGLLLVRKGKR